jgi:hypothetical protein
VKQRLLPVHGFKSAVSATIIIRGHGLVQSLWNSFSTLTQPSRSSCASRLPGTTWRKRSNLHRRRHFAPIARLGDLCTCGVHMIAT